MMGMVEEVERVARVGLERADAAFAEHQVWVFVGEHIFAASSHSSILIEVRA